MAGFPLPFIPDVAGLKTLGEIDLIAVTAAQIGLHLTKFLALTSAWQSNMSRQQYGEKFRQVQAYLRSGDCYQVCWRLIFDCQAEVRVKVSPGAGVCASSHCRRCCGPTVAQADIALPDLAVGIYDWALIVDHQRQQVSLLAVLLAAHI
jgi:anthranilate/para-aminobenzoate synthase component I